MHHSIWLVWLNNIYKLCDILLYYSYLVEETMLMIKSNEQKNYQKKKSNEQNSVMMYINWKYFIQKNWKFRRKQKLLGK